MLPAVRSGARCFSARSRGARAGLPLARQAAPEQSRQCVAQCACVVRGCACACVCACVVRGCACACVRGAVARACVRVMSPSAPPTPISSWYARKCSACALSRSGETTPDELDRPSCLRSDSASPPPTHKARPLALARAAGMLHLPVSPRLSPHLERPGCYISPPLISSGGDAVSGAGQRTSPSSERWPPSGRAMAVAAEPAWQPVSRHWPTNSHYQPPNPRCPF